MEPASPIALHENMVSMSSQRCYYEVLGVEKTASGDEIKRAYKKLAARYHPDRNRGDDEAVTLFKEASAAYSVLSDSDKRARYDRYGHAGVSGNGGGGFSDVGDIFDAFGDIFEGFGMFGGGRGRSRSRASRGPSLKTSLTIDLLDAARGCERTIDLEREELCDTCDGSGAKPGTSPEQCEYCGGHGQVVQSQGFFRVQTTCPACRGVGTMVREKCSDCGGSGRQSETVKLDVRIPAGIDNGMQLCLRGEGEPGTSGGPRGDVYIDIHVREHSLFQRSGLNLTCRIPLTYTQAALGTEMEIPILDGRHQLTIPPGTQPGEVIRLRGFGMPDPHGRGTGDLFVQIQVEVPKKLDDAQEKLLRELADLEHANVSPHRRSFFDKVKEYFTLPDDDE